MFGEFVVQCFTLFHVLVAAHHVVDRLDMRRQITRAWHFLCYGFVLPLIFLRIRQVVGNHAVDVVLLEFPAPSQIRPEVAVA